MATSTEPFETLIESARDEGLSDYLESVRADCVLLVPGPAGALGCSRIGGWPDLPPEFDWPTWDVTAYDQKELEEAQDSLQKHPTDYMKKRVDDLKARTDREPLPLSFVAQLNLADFAESQHGLNLPTEGHLWFFFELSESPWGYCPTHRGGFRVLQAPAGTKLEPREAPAGTAELPSKPVQASPAWSVPTWPKLEDDLVDDELGVMWGDVGSLFWWIKADDLAQGAWDQAWFQLQSG